MKEILKVIHDTIYQFFDVCGDDEEVHMSDKDKLLLEVNKAICNNLKSLNVPYTNVGDLISRQAALEILDDYAENIESGNWGTAYSKARMSMCDLPSVEPERKLGKWVHHTYCRECSECGERISYYYTYNYCPNCGADMRKENGNESR